MGKVAREKAVEADADDAHFALLQAHEFAQSRPKPRQQPRRRPPIDAEPPAEGAVATAPEIAMERSSEGVAGEKGGNDQHDMTAARDTRDPRLRRELAQERPCLA